MIFQKRTEEAPQRIKQAIADGVFGKMAFGDASIKYWRNQAYYDSADWRSTWAKEGGGASMTQGTHGIDLLLFMMGDVEKIYAWMDTFAHTRIEVEDIALALLKFKNGAYGRLQTATATNPGQGNVFEFNGTCGTRSSSRTRSRVGRSRIRRKRSPRIPLWVSRAKPARPPHRQPSSPSKATSSRSPILSPPPAVSKI